MRFPVKIGYRGVMAKSPVRKPAKAPSRSRSSSQKSAGKASGRKPGRTSKASGSAWGEEVTRYFFDLSPDRVLQAMEAAGYSCTGLCYALNSYENRVYEIEVEAGEGIAAKQGGLTYPSRRIVKFYRPGRWSGEQIREEHGFIQDLVVEDVPAVAPFRFPDGATLAKTKEGDLWYTVFPKMGGRTPDELDDELARRVGRLLARIHNAGAARDAPHRIKLTPETYGLANLEFLLMGGWFPEERRGAFEQTIREICDRSDRLFRDFPAIRTHGDCHRGNLLWNGRDLFFVDFDDIVIAPPVQDLWLLVPGRDDYGRRIQDLLLDGYSQMRRFDHRSLILVEPLRALRIIHFAAWIARRWQDPAFPRTFINFNTPRYWSDLEQDLREQLSLIREAEAG